MKTITLKFSKGNSITIDYISAINSIVNEISTYNFNGFDDEYIIEKLDIPNKFIEKVNENENDNIILDDNDDYHYYILKGLKEKIVKEIYY